MDANKTAGEETRWQLHKNAACNPEQVLAAIPHKTPTVRPCVCMYAHKRCTLMDPHTRAAQKQDDQHERTIQQLCEDTGCCPEDLPRAMNDREEYICQHIHTCVCMYAYYIYIYIHISLYIHKYFQREYGNLIE